MTLQVQQVFVGPLAAPVIGAALGPDVVKSDGQAEDALFGDLANCDFARLLQDAVSEAENFDIPSAPSVPMPVDLGLQAAVVAKLAFCPPIGTDPGAAPAPELPATPLLVQPKDGPADPKGSLSNGPAPALPVERQGVEDGSPPTAPLLPQPAVIISQRALNKPAAVAVASIGSGVAAPELTEKVIAKRTTEKSAPDPVEAPPLLPAGPKLSANPGLAPPPPPNQAVPVPLVNAVMIAPPPAMLLSLADHVLSADPASNAPLPLPSPEPSQDLKTAMNTALDMAAPLTLSDAAVSTKTRYKSVPATPAEIVFRLRLGAAAAGSREGVPTDPPQSPDVINASLQPRPFARTAQSFSVISNVDAPEPVLPDQPSPEESATPQGARNPDTSLPPSPTAISDPARLPSTPPPQTNGAVTAMQPAPIALPPRLGADLIALTKSPSRGSVEILLNPEELGHLRFEIHQKADQLRVVLSVERPETMDLLRRNTDQLLGEFRAAGFSGASLSFGNWDHQNSNPRASPASPPSGPQQEQESAPPLSPPPQPHRQSTDIAASTGLNIRL